MTDGLYWPTDTSFTNPHCYCCAWLQSRGGVGEWLMGSVASQLTHHCESPVVVLHKPKKGGKPKAQEHKTSSHDQAQVLGGIACGKHLFKHTCCTVPETV